MYKISVISSGSKGNCVAVKINGDIVLIDCGISYKQLSKKMFSIGLSTNDITHVFVSHSDHGDHFNGIPVLLKRHRNIKVFGAGTKVKMPECGFVHIGQGAWFKAVKADHDVDCVSWVWGDGCGNKGAYVSDTGSIPCSSLKYLIDVNAIIIETNHDTDMLFESWYSEEMQQRVYETHFENSQAHDLLKLVSWDGLEFVVGHHLSKVNNKTELAYFELRSAVHEKCNVVIASQEEPTKLMTII